ncbi:MAG: acetate--CoA ligase family protein [Bacteroidota bacterium]|nr:acetate--CoA ligase family protein [Bacteroidota bacterium]
MINEYLLNPRSIAVIGGSANIHKPGGKILKNINDGGFRGALYAVNPKETNIPGAICYTDVEWLPETDLAILAIPARLCPDVVDVLALQKQTKAFIILSAGFSEESHDGALLEKRIVDRINGIGGCLIGPNCIGILTASHHSLFTSPIPNIDPRGCELISSSGATAVFILESGLTKGLRFASVFSVGNSAQVGVEDVLQYLDETFDPLHSSKVKLLYIESLKDPDRLLRHASSLIRKGGSIAAIKAGSSQAGSRAAASHTGAIASSDLAVEALFRKAGIVRCLGREELVTVASVFMHKAVKGKNIAIITQAGGPAVMLADALSKGGLEIPAIHPEDADNLKLKLFAGASVQNPIDLLATGTASQLEMVIDACERFSYIDAMMVIFGSPGLEAVFDAYDVLHHKMQTCSKPIFPILPSVITARREVEFFIDKGHVNFPDEVLLGSALVKVINTHKPAAEVIEKNDIDVAVIRNVIDNLPPEGYVAPLEIRKLLQLASIDVVSEVVSANKDEVLAAAADMGYPVVAKVVGPVHKSDVGGVALNVRNDKLLSAEFDRLIALPEASAVMVQPMLTGRELFIGAKYEPRFGHIILCGLGGIFVEVLEDVSSGLAPLSYNEAYSMIRSLKSYKIIKGTRGQAGINEEKFADTIVRLSLLLRHATEIKELDLNPLLGSKDSVTVVDARLYLKK